MQLTVPPVPEGMDSTSWRRHLTGLDPAKKGAYRALGPRLNAGDLVEVPQGALVLVVDRALRGFKERFVSRYSPVSGSGPVPQLDATVTVYLADGGALVELWSRQYIDGKSAFGATTMKKLTALLAGHPVPREQVEVLHEARRPNRREGRCRWCSGLVWAEAGHLAGHGQDAEVEHYEQCPPRLVPREGRHPCVLCGVEVVPHQADKVLRRDGSGQWEVRHRKRDGLTCLDKPVASPDEQRAALAERDRAERERAEAQRAEQYHAEAKKREAAERRARKKREAHEAEQARVAGLATVDRRSTGLFDKGLGGARRARLVEHTDTLEDGTTTKRWTVEVYYTGSMTPNAYGDYDEDAVDTAQEFTDLAAARAEYRTHTFEPGGGTRGGSHGRASGGGHGPCAECGDRGGVVERSDSSGISGWVCSRCDRDNPDDVTLSFA